MQMNAAQKHSAVLPEIPPGRRFHRLDRGTKRLWLNVRDLQPLGGLRWSAWVAGNSEPGDQLQIPSNELQLERGLDVLLRMDQQGTVPSVNMYRCLLKDCAKRKALAEARRVHAHLAGQGLDLTTFLGEYAVTTLVKCGGLRDALQLFHRLPLRTAFSWTALISGYTMAGKGQEALEMYRWMEAEGVKPSIYTFVSALKACASIADLREGKRIHAAAVMHRCDSEMMVRTCLVHMYAKCGSMVDAQNVFDRFPQRDIVAWNAMLAAYARQGQPDKVFQLCNKMREEGGASPNERTFVCMLQACGMLAESRVVVNGRPEEVITPLELGREIHAYCLAKGYTSDVFIGSTLISMYGKSGSISDAQNVFDKMNHHSVVSWNALLAAYVEQGQAEKVLQLYACMWEEALRPDARTFVSTLQACGVLAEKEEDLVVHNRPTKAHSLNIGKAIHAEARREGCESNAFVGNTLVVMYGKCRSIVEARLVFDGLSYRNVVSWTSMLAAYVEQGQAEQTLQLYEQMLEEGISANNITFVTVLQACTMLGEKEDRQSYKAQFFEMGRVVHANIRSKCCESDPFIGSTLITMYGTVGSSLCARNVFDELSQRDVVSWNAMLVVYAQHGQPEKALQLYGEMCEEGISPNCATFVSALQVCGMLAEKQDGDGQTIGENALAKGKVVHACAWRTGHGSDGFLGNTLITMYAKCGSMHDAHNMFDAVSQHDVVARNAIIAAYAQHGQAEVALKLYREMQADGVSPNEVTYMCILQACSSTGSLDICKEIHHNLVSTQKHVSTLLGTTLIHAYGKCASMVTAQAAFDALPTPNVFSWTALIAGYARQGDWQGSMQSYQEMLVAGAEPDGVTFLALLSVCSHAGLVDKAVEYFESMIRDHGIIPDVEHYVSMVDLLGRAGCFAMVDHLLSGMPMRPNLAIWLCLLNASRKHARVGLGKQAFDFAVHQDPKNAAAYVLMWNIYVDAGLWDRAEEVQELRHKECGWTKRCPTWIEHDQEVHSFVVEHRMDAKQEPLYELLSKVKPGEEAAPSIATRPPPLFRDCRKD